MSYVFFCLNYIRSRLLCFVSEPIPLLLLSFVTCLLFYFCLPFFNFMFCQKALSQKWYDGGLSLIFNLNYVRWRSFMLEVAGSNPSAVCRGPSWLVFLLWQQRTPFHELFFFLFRFLAFAICICYFISFFYIAKCIAFLHTLPTPPGHHIH